MNIFLIDYENVGINGFKGIEKLNSNDEIVIFYSPNSDNIKIDIINSIITNGVSLKIFKLKKADKNALDFQLVTYLGNIISNLSSQDTITIISKDNGYQSSIDFCKTYFHINVNKFDDIYLSVTGGKPNNINSNSVLSTLTNLEKRTKIEQILESNETLKYILLENQFKQISAILVDDTKNTQESATEYIKRCIGLKKEHLIPIILECCKEFIR